MGKIRKGKILVIAILMMIASFFVFTGKVNAYFEPSYYGELAIEGDPEYVRGKCVNAPKVHLIINGREIEPEEMYYDGDGKRSYVSGVHTATSNASRLPDDQGFRCSEYLLPDADDVNLIYNYYRNSIWDIDGYGIVDWYDNPEFEGEPIREYIKYDESYLHQEDHSNEDRYYYAKMGKIIKIHYNGLEIKTVAGKLYSPKFLDLEYDVISGEYSEPVYYSYIYPPNSMDKQTYVKLKYDTELPSFTQDWLGKKFFRVQTHQQRHSGLKLEDGFKVYIDSSDTLPLIDYSTLKWSKATSNSYIRYEYSAKVMDVFTEEQAVIPRGYTDTESISFEYEIPRYYEYLGAIDQYGNEYPAIFEMKEEYDGRILTPVIDSDMRCTDVSYYYSPGATAVYYGGDKVHRTGIKLLTDFDSNFMPTVLGKAYVSSEAYIEDREGYTINHINSCLPYDVYQKVEIEIDPSLLPNYAIILNGKEITKVQRNSTYTLPTEGVIKPADTFVVNLKFQDGKTSDEALSYTKIYEPIGFLIDGVHYDFGDKILVTNNIYMETDYEEHIIGPDLPTPTREKYNFKGWFDTNYGGHKVDKIVNNTYKTLYAQWADKDFVFVTRPDGITIELEKGSEYIIPATPSKLDEVVSRVVFYKNDETTNSTASQVIRTYTKNGIICKETGTRYDNGQKIIVNENMTLLGNYDERIIPATFPNNPTRDDYDFLGWFNDIEDGIQYTEYSGDKDLALYAHWAEAGSTVTITFKDSACPKPNDPMTGGCRGEDIIRSIKLDRNSTYTLPYNNTYARGGLVRLYYDDGEDHGNPEIISDDMIRWVQYIGNGWYIDGVHYDELEEIIVDKSMTANQDLVQVIGAPVKLPTPTRAGYTFQGWFDERNEKVYFDLYDDIESVELHAHWKKIDNYKLPEIPAKNPETVAAVTLKFQDNLTKDKNKYVKKNYIAINYLVNGGDYDNEYFNVGDTIDMSDDVTITPIYEEQIVGVDLYSATREGYYFQGWFDDPENGTRYSYYDGEGDITLYAQWTTEPMSSLCKRATTLHKNGSTTYGRLGTPGELVVGDAFDCDVNGDGVYDSETERFYYINDYYDAELGEYNHSIASLVYYNDYMNGIVSINDTTTYTKYGTGVSNEGPTVASTYLPTEQDWPNVKLYKTQRKLTSPYKTTTNGYGEYETFDYSGYAARMVNAVEIVDSGCVYNFNIAILKKYYNLNHTCDFLGENIRKNPNDPLKERGYWVENPQGYCKNGVNCRNQEITWAYNLIMDNNQTNWDGIHLQGRESNDNGRLKGVRPAIDVPKTAIEDNPGETIMHSITYPEGDIQYALHKSTYQFGDVNTSSSVNNEYTVTFDYNDDGETESVTSTGISQSIPAAWKIGNTIYNKDDQMIVLDDYILEYIYSDISTPVEFPEEPTRDGYTFVGWFDALYGGNEYTSYNETEDITLYARWIKDVPPIPEGMLCIRATELHEGTYYDTPVTYGNLGTLGELHSGDAFTCDINGDGVYDEATERFYYVSDYYDTEEGEFDSNYAALIYYTFVGTRDIYSNEQYSIELYEKYFTGNGPTTIYNKLPSISDWSNSSLKTLDRSITAVRGTNLDIELDDWVHAWKEETVEPNTECTMMPAEGYEDNVCEYQVVGQEEQETNCRNEETNCREEGGWDDPEMGYMPGEWVCDYEYVCDHEMVDVWDNVCETVWVETIPEHEECFDHPEIVYVDHSENVTINYATFTYYNKAARLLNAHELSSATGITNFVDETRITLSGNEYLLESGDEYFLENPYDPDNTWSIYADGILKTNEVGTGNHTAYVVPVIDVPKSAMQISSTDHTVTLPDRVDTVPHETPYTIPKNKYDKEPEDGTTITFKYNNGHEDTTARVQKTFVKNGFTIDGDHYDSNEVYVVLKDIELIPDYTEERVSPKFPTPTKNGYLFKGWYDYNGNEVTEYNGTEDITLFAKWSLDKPEPGPYVLPVNDLTKAAQINTVTFKPENGEDDIVRTVTSEFKPDGWLVDGAPRAEGETITVTENTVIEPNFSILRTSAVEFPDDPVKENFEFTGWCATRDTGGTCYNSYYKSEDITLYAHYIYIGDVTPYTLGVNNQTKPDEILATITFKYHNGMADTTSNVVKTYTANGWLVDNTWYADGVTVSITPYSTIVPNFDDRIVNAQFPSNPTKDGLEFIGWFTAETGGKQIGLLNGTEDLTLHAQYTANYAILAESSIFHEKICYYYGDSSQCLFGIADSFRPATPEEVSHVDFNSFTERNIISSDNSPMPIYVWPEGKERVYYSEADVMYMLYPDHLFEESGFKEIDLSGFNTIKATSMRDMFVSAEKTTTIKFGDGFITSNVTNMSRMFDYCGELKNIDLSGFDTSKVTDMSQMFSYSAKMKKLDLSNFDTRNVTTMEEMFSSIGAVELDLSNFNTSNVTNMGAMFSESESLKSIDVSSFDTSKVTDMHYMFDNTSVKELDLSSFDTSKVTDMSGMFAYAFNLKTIYVSDKWNTNLVSNSGGMFEDCENIVGQEGTVYDSSHLDKEYAHVDGGVENPGYLTMDRQTKAHYVYLPDYSEKVNHGSSYIIPTNRYDKETKISTITFDYQDGRDNTTSQVQTTYVNNGFTINEDHYDTNEVIIVLNDIYLYPDYVTTTTNAIFPEDPTREGYTFLGWFDLPNSGIKYTSYSINHDITLYARWLKDGDYILPVNDQSKPEEVLSTITFKYYNGTEDTTSSVVRYYKPNGWLVDGVPYPNGATITRTDSTVIEPNFNEFIRNAEFPTNPTKEGYKFTGWYTEETAGDKVTVLRGTENLVLHAQYTNNYAVISANRFNRVINRINNAYNQKDLIFRKATLEEYNDVYSSLDFSDSYQTTNIVSGNYLPSYVDYSPVPVYLWRDGNKLLYYSEADVIFMPEYSGGMFSYSDKVVSIDLSDLNSSLVKSLFFTFGSCRSLTEIIFGDFDTHSVEDMTSTFSSLESITSLDLSSFDTHKVRNMRSLFYSCKALTNIDMTDNFDTSNVTNMSQMFSDCTSLTYVDFSKLDTSKVQDMSGLFLRDRALVEVKFSGNDTREVTTMKQMFDYCTSLTTVDVSGFDTSNVTDMSQMFSQCNSLTSIDVSNFDTSKVTLMSSMFYACYSLDELYVNNFDTRNVTNMSDMFGYCYGLQKLDLSNFDTRNVTDMSIMFRGDRALTSIDVSNFDTRNVTKMNSMFSGTKLLKELDLSNFDTRNVTDFSSMFNEADSLEVLDLSSFVTDEEDNYNDMFYGQDNIKTVYVSRQWNAGESEDPSHNRVFYKNNNIVGQMGTTFDPQKVDKTYARIDEGESKPGYFSIKSAHTITYPDFVETVPHGTKFSIPNNTYDKERINLATVTFVYGDGREDVESPVQNEFVKYGFTIDDIHYDTGDIYIVNKDITLVPDYVEMTKGVTFPSNPTREGYSFVGWFTDPTDGTQVTEYTEDEDITLYAHWTFAQGHIVLPVNNIPKDDVTAVVTFKYNDEGQTADTTTTIGKQYIPNGWLVDGVPYADNSIIDRTSDTVIEPNYVEVIVSGEFPSEPTRFQYDFVGWFDAEAGGNQYTIDDITESITLYAHWVGEGYPTPIDGLLCYRARDLSSNSSTGHEYGNLGTEGELNLGDAYICDVNGDGILNSSDERFYYLSDYYNTATGEFDNEWATMVYSLPVSEGEGYEIDCYGCESSQYYNSPGGWSGSKNYEGPVTALSDIPTVAQWSNSSLFTTNRQIRTVDGNTYIQGPYTNSVRRDLPVFSYTGYAARMITIQEYNEGCNESITSSNIEYSNYIPNSCDFLSEGLDFWEAGPDAPDVEHSEFMFESPIDGEESNVAVGNYGGRIDVNRYGAVKVAIDVPKEAIDLRVGEKTYNVRYPDNKDETVKAGTVITIPENNTSKAESNGAKVTFKPENGGSDIIAYVKKKPVGDGIELSTNGYSGWTRYATGATYTVNSNVYLRYAYTDQYINVKYPKDVIKAGYVIEGWYTEPNGEGTRYDSYNGTSAITLYANWTKKIGPYTLPENEVTKNPENIATVTFKQLNGKADIIRYVVATYTPNGWLVDGEPHQAGDRVIMTEDTVIEPAFITTVSPAAFPENPTRNKYVFNGWADSENPDTYGSYTYYTSYDGNEDITLYAIWTTDDNYCTVTYSDGETVVVQCGSTITVPSKIEGNSETLTFHYTYGWYDDMMDYWDTWDTSFDRTFYEYKKVSRYKYKNTTYNCGDTITINSDAYIERIYGEVNYEDQPFEVPDDAYSFGGWFSEQYGQGKLLRSYYDYKSYGLTTKDIYAYTPERDYYTVTLDGELVGEFESGELYTLPEGHNVDRDIATVTLVNGEETTTHKVHQVGTFYNFEVDGDYWDSSLVGDPGDNFQVNENLYITSYYEPNEITPVTIPQLDSTDNYVFKGWFTEPNGQGGSAPLEYFEPIDITFYSYFEGKAATVYYYDGSDDQNLIYEGNYKYGDYVDTTNIRTNNSFDGNGKVHLVYQNGTNENDEYLPIQVEKEIIGWKGYYTNIDNSGGYEEYGLTYTVDFIGRAEFDPLFSNGYSAYLVLPTPNDDIHPGYNFTGWYTLPEGGTRVTKITEDRDTTVYAHWVRNTDPICEYSTGRTEYCDEGTPIYVNSDEFEVVSHVYEIINAKIEENYNKVYNTLEVGKYKFIDYYEINGEKYYPGDYYYVDDSLETYIDVHYIGEGSIEPVTLDVMSNEEATTYNNTGWDNYKFTGWYTDRKNGDLVTHYSGEEDTTVYAQYKIDKWEDKYYHLQFIYLDESTYEIDVPENTVITLNDEYTSVVPFHLDIYGDETEIIGETGLIHFPGNDYSVNGTIYHKGDKVIINEDTIITSLSTNPTITYNPEITDPVKEGYIFTGWYYDDTIGWYYSNKVDFNTLDLYGLDVLSGKTVYGTFEEYDPIEDVIVDFDGEIYTVKKGSSEELPIDYEKPGDFFLLELNPIKDYIQAFDIIREYELQYYTVNGEMYSPGQTVTYNTDTVIRSVNNVTYSYADWVYNSWQLEYPDLWDISDQFEDFEGWYTELEGGELVEDASELTETTTLYARYPKTHKLTVDGVTTTVPDGYIYTVPASIANDGLNSITIKLHYNDEDDPVETTISRGKNVNYQTIGNYKYYPNDIYVVNADTVVTTTLGDDTVVFDPEVVEPYREGYVFLGWLQISKFYFTTTNESQKQQYIDEGRYIDVNSIVPDYEYRYPNDYLAMFSEEPNPNQVVIHYVDKTEDKDYRYIVDKNTVINLDDISGSHTYEGIWMYSVVGIPDNINSKMSMTMDISLDYYEVNGKKVAGGSTYTATTDTEIIVHRTDDVSYTCYDGNTYETFTCPESLFVSPESYVTYEGTTYIIHGIYPDFNDSWNGHSYFEWTGPMIDLSKAKLIKSSEGDYYPSFGSGIYMDAEELGEQIILTVDNEATLIDKGMGNIPDAKTKANDIYRVTYDYNNGANSKKETDEIVVSYTFDHYNVIGVGEFQAGAIYNYQENTTMYSVFNSTVNYPEIRKILSENFVGWFTEPHGGEEVTTLEGIDRNITLYARYNNEAVNVYIEGETYTLLYGEEFTFPEWEDKNSNNIDVVLDYDDGEHSPFTRIKTTYDFDSFEYNGTEYHPGDTMVVTEDRYVDVNYDEQTTFDPEYVAPVDTEDRVFIGWVDQDGEPVDVPNLKGTDMKYHRTTITATYEDKNEEQIVVDFDGNKMVVDKNTIGISDLNSMTSPLKPENEVMTIHLDYNDGSGYIEDIDVIKTYTTSGYLVNDNEVSTDSDMMFDEDVVVRSIFGSSYAPDIFSNIPTGATGIYNANGDRVENYDNVQDGDTLYYHYEITHTVTLEGEVIATVEHGARYTLPINNKPREMENVATVTFNYMDGRENEVNYVRRRFNNDGWTINDENYISGSFITVNEDIELIRKYTETVQGVDFPVNPTRNKYEFAGWYTEDTYVNKVESYNGTEDITLYAKWGRQVTITEDGEISIEPQGFQKVLGTKPNKNEKSFTITFKYNYEGSPADKVLTLSKYDKFTGWDVNGEFVEAGTLYTFIEDTVLTSQYETVINNNNLPNDPTRNGYRFIGWYSNSENGTEVDITEINKNTTVYAHWVVDDPTKVTLTWDGKTTIHDKGTIINLDRSEDKTKETKVATVTFVMNKDGYDNKKVYINNVYTRDHLVINDVNHDDTGEYTLNEDTVINSVYTNEIIYPELPKVSDGRFLGFYTSATGGTEVTTLEGITTDTTYYAHWSAETVTIDFDGDIYEVEKGTEINFTQGKAKGLDNISVTFDYNYEGVNNKVVTFTTTYVFDYYSVNDEKYYVGEKYTANEDTVIRSMYTESESNDFEGYLNNDWDLGYKPGNEYLTNWTTTRNGDTEVDFSEFLGKNSSYNNSTIYAKYEEVTGEISVTIDSMDPYTIIPGEQILIPNGMELSLDEPNSESFDITFVDNGNSETRTVTKSYEFDYFTLNGNGKYQRDDIVTFVKDSIIKSNWKANYSYPSIPTNDNDRFLGWFTKEEGGLQVTTLEGITESTILYAHYLENNYVVYFDGVAYTYDDFTTSVNPVILGYASNETEKTFSLILDYQDENVDNQKFDYSVNSVHVGWTDSNNQSYGETISLSSETNGEHYTSIYNVGSFEPVYLSLYSPSNDKFIGWYTAPTGGERVYQYNGFENKTYYAQYMAPTQASVTIDDEVEIYNIGDTLTLPAAKTKDGSAITITFEPENGDSSFTRSITTSYTFEGFKYAKDNQNYNPDATFTVEEDMVFNSEFTKVVTQDTWPEEPTKENYFFLGWYTARNAGVEIFGYDDINSNTTLYAHYTTNPEYFITITNTVTGESVSVMSGSDWTFGDSKFNKTNKEKLGTITYKFNSDGYSDEHIDYYRTSTPSGYYVNGGDTVYSIDEVQNFTADTSITPYYAENDIVTDTHVGIDQFDYEITNGNKTIKCFSKTDQTDPLDNEEYTCYENYDENDGNVTVYLHWQGRKQVTVTDPDGLITIHTEGDEYDLGTNNKPKSGKSYTVTFNYQDGRDNTTQTYSENYTNNGFLVNGTHYNDETVLTLTEDIVIERDYTYSETLITLPEPERENYTFIKWNSETDGSGTTYTDSNINKLTSDTTAYAIWASEDITLSFESNGGEDVSDITVAYNTPIGDVLPTTSKENERRTVNNENVIIGYIFDGWYREDTFENKVSTSSTFTEDTTLYAKWIEDEFPYVYPYHEENFVCTGSNYIDTGVKLYTQTNNDYLKDFEVGFTIESYTPSGQVKQAVFFNAKWEVQSQQWPGIAFRRKDETVNLELSSSAKKTRVAQDVIGYTIPLDVRIYRIDNVIYLSTDGGETKTQVQDTTGFSQFFDVNSYFCAGDNGNGGIQRYVKGTISNYYIKLGDYQGTAEDLDTHTVTYPDGNVETYGHNTILELDANESTKTSDIGASVTFDYNDGVTASEIRYVTRNYTPNGFIVNGTTHYDDNSTLVVNEDKVLTYDYTSENEGVEFPSNPTRENYEFEGWFDEDGNEVKYYDGDDNITLYAHWKGETIIVCVGDDCIEVPYGSEFTIPDDDSKDNDVIATVTFKYHNGDPDTTSTVEKSYTFVNWKDQDDNTYTSGDVITITHRLDLTPVYDETIIPATWPSDPEKEGADFQGWYTREEGGTPIDSYEGNRDIDVHAQWNMTFPTDFDIDSDDIYMMVGETHQIEVTFIPDESSDTLTYTSSDEDIATVSDEGLITAVEKGVITIIVSADNADIDKVITVTVVSDKLESDVYEVRDKDPENESSERIVIGAEVGSTIEEFKNNMLNDYDHIKIYDEENNLVSDDDKVRTGLTIKLEINGTTYDTAIMVIRGDVDKDGFVNVTDYIMVLNHAIALEPIDDFIAFTAGNVEEDEFVNVSDYIEILNFVIKNRDSLNE